MTAFVDDETLLDIMRENEEGTTKSGRRRDKPCPDCWLYHAGECW